MSRFSALEGVINPGKEVQRLMLAASAAGFKPAHVNGYDANPLEQLPDVVGMALLSGIEHHVRDGVRFPRPVAAVLRRVPPVMSGEAIIWQMVVYGEQNRQRLEKALSNKNVGLDDLVLLVLETHSGIKLFERLPDE